MTKTQLIEYVNKLKYQALEKVRNEFKEQKTDLIREYIKTNNLEPEITKISTILQLTKKECDKLIPKINIPLYGYNNVFNNIEREILNCSDPIQFIEANYQKCEIKGFKLLGELEEKSVEEVRRTYHNVMSNIRSLKSIKLALEYVNELGFTLPEGENKPSDLMIKIDSRFLIMKGDV